MSIMSFPDRGPWGNAKWRGNCSGHVYRQLFEQILGRVENAVFIDPMMGSGTSIEVATEMGIKAYGLDLHQGFNILRDSIVGVTGDPGHLVLSHPPYHKMIEYSGRVWGTEAHPDDLSRCVDDEDFHQKMHLAMLNQREATLPGGYYGCIIGDWRRNGVYTSYQAEIIARLPAPELAGVLIKAQHNASSSFKSYGKLDLPFIMHEYIVLFRRKTGTILAVLGAMASQAKARLQGTWRNIVRSVLIGLGGTAPLAAIYDAVSASTDRIKTNSNWREKIRQTLQIYPDFKSEERGVWGLA
ncbi:site-specific DNA-methyltransferase [Burkholderia stabilis]|uniref:site-specific DNA-methyltransferase n=1 Tax=Burkholderia stabilis TaxID=95485 RepID=UPI001F4B4D93|nr:site-specific DNA-methyltransferase [Burkholderia stabilis]